MDGGLMGDHAADVRSTIQPSSNPPLRVAKRGTARTGIPEGQQYVVRQSSVQPRFDSAPPAAFPRRKLRALQKHIGKDDGLVAHLRRLIPIKCDTQGSLA